MAKNYDLLIWQEDKAPEVRHIPRVEGMTDDQYRSAALLADVTLRNTFRNNGSDARVHLVGDLPQALEPQMTEPDRDGQTTLT